MSTASVSAIFTGANHQNQVSDYNKEREIIAFGAGQNIALWKPLDKTYRGVYATLKGHTAEITCCRFLSSDMLISTSEDFKIKIWKFDSENTTEPYATCIQTIEHYTHTVTTLDCEYGNSAVFSTGSADGKVSMWCLDHEVEQFKLRHEFVVKKGVFPLCLSIKRVENTNAYLMAVGGTNVNVFIYSFVLNENNDVDNFKLIACMDGHEDWIKCLDFRKESDFVYTLATGSQDRYIRLWKIDIAYKDKKIEEEDSKKLSLLSNKKYKFEIVSGMSGAINFEALIMGHDDWVSSIKWHETKQQLLASTANTELMVWEPESASGIWICNSRLGELSSKGASTATGSSGGFWSCIWFTKDDTEYVFTNGKTGSWRCWSCPINGVEEPRQEEEKEEIEDNEESPDEEEDEEDVFDFMDASFKVWKSELAITGPFKEATDVAWSENGYLLATSLDQTTRLLSKWNMENERNATWKEFSRPQIHGYDMICVEPISNTRFISGGDEKILRSFDEPKGVAQILSKFSNINANAEEMPESASLPVLGLSNKATSDARIQEDEDPDTRETEENTNITYDLISSLTGPPVEDQLQRHTLWPEIEKLYGHGYEITCVDVSPDKKLVATACRSNTQQHAVIRIFDTTSWLQLKPVLPFHNLTVTRLRFSKDNKYLLSVSRDRQWAIWERNMNDNTFVLKYKNEKPHTRIIWDAEWCPLEFDDAFITASRDKSLKIWSHDEDNFTLKNSIKLEEPVTALSVLNRTIAGKLIIAVGLESGAISIITYTHEAGFTKVLSLDDKITPSDRNNRLRWKPITDNSKTGEELSLAAASNDHSIRIYSVSSSLF